MFNDKGSVRVNSETDFLRYINRVHLQCKRWREMEGCIILGNVPVIPQVGSWGGVQESRQVFRDVGAQGRRLKEWEVQESGQGLGGVGRFRDRSVGFSVGVGS